MDVQVKLGAKFVALIEKALKKHTWLGFNSVDEFAVEVIRQRVEVLLSLPSQ